MTAHDEVIVEIVPIGLPAMTLVPMLSKMEMPSVARKMNGSR